MEDEISPGHEDEWVSKYLDELPSVEDFAAEVAEEARTVNFVGKDFVHPPGYIMDEEEERDSYYCGREAVIARMQGEMEEAMGAAAEEAEEAGLPSEAMFPSIDGRTHCDVGDLFDAIEGHYDALETAGIRGELNRDKLLGKKTAADKEAEKETEEEEKEETQLDTRSNAGAVGGGDLAGEGGPGPTSDDGKQGLDDMKLSALKRGLAVMKMARTDGEAATLYLYIQCTRVAIGIAKSRTGIPQRCMKSFV